MNDGPPGGFRYEIKVPFSGGQLPNIRSLVRSHPAGFVTEWPPRTVNNLYFDSADFECLEDGLQGLCVRGKLRLRWYGQSAGSGKYRLEWKAKHAVLGAKLTAVVTLPEALEQIDLMLLPDMLRQRADPRFVPLLARFGVPVVVNSYTRDYLVSGDGVVRLTLDRDLKFFEQTGRARLNLDRPSPEEEFCVLELKFDPAAEDQARAIMDLFYLRPAACSKYALGITGSAPLF